MLGFGDAKRFDVGGEELCYWVSGAFRCVGVPVVLSTHVVFEETAVVQWFGARSG